MRSLCQQISFVHILSSIRAYMGKIFLVRHGQASLGAANYDQLSPLGVQQSQRLGEYFKDCGLQFEAAYCGTLQRQHNTLTHILNGLGDAASNCPITHCEPLNEYDSHSVMECVHKGPIPDPRTPEGYKAFFRLLRLALLHWITQPVTPVNTPSFTNFRQGIRATLNSIQTKHADGGSVLVVSSGGPISTALADLMCMGAQAQIELNLGLRNTSVCELQFNRGRISVVSFNALAHLAHAKYKDWITYA